MPDTWQWYIIWLLLFIFIFGISLNDGYHSHWNVTNIVCTTLSCMYVLVFGIAFFQALCSKKQQTEDYNIVMNDAFVTRDVNNDVDVV
jgi:hypothetical protein